MNLSSVALCVVLVLSSSCGYSQTTHTTDHNEQPTRQAQLIKMNEQALKHYLSTDMDPNKLRNIAFILSSPNPAQLEKLRNELVAKGLMVGKVWLLKKEGDIEHHVLEIIFKQTLNERDKLLKYSQLIDDMAKENQLQFIGWAAGKADN